MFSKTSKTLTWQDTYRFYTYALFPPFLCHVQTCKCSMECYWTNYRHTTCDLYRLVKTLAQTYNDIAASFKIRLIWFALVIFFTTEELKTITKARHSIQYENLKNPIWVASLDFIVWWSAFNSSSAAKLYSMGTFLNCSFILSIIGFILESFIIIVLILESLSSLLAVMLLEKCKKRLICSNWLSDIISATWGILVEDDQ